VLGKDLRARKPTEIHAVWPGAWEIKAGLEACADAHDIPLVWRLDRHFLDTPEEFNAHAEGRKQLRLEYYFRDMRRRHGVLMDGDQPVGGAWNFDTENREAFGRDGPGRLKFPRSFEPDAITRVVLAEVEEHFGDHPGSLHAFDWPVTSAQAREALDDFVQERLPDFGRYQDALWIGEPYLYHSRLSSSLNLKLLDPREVIAKAEAAYRDGHAPLASVEGFIRQILGWREYVRGIYWRHMPEYLDQNALGAKNALPDFYWTGATEMICLRDAIMQTLAYGYAHHIQRLMVTGLYALLLGVEPRQVHEWSLAVYVDAVEWVEVPNTLGMSQYADGGLMASKPYAATGKYIQRMGPHCKGCRFDPNQRTGPRACPFTTLYWDFLARNQQHLASNPRMKIQLRNLANLDPLELAAIREQAQELMDHGGVPQAPRLPALFEVEDARR
jgi:deoxyribodipyrimidine photolyase-related protein